MASIQNMSEWQNADVPEHLTPEFTRTLHAAMLNRQQELVHSESMRLGRSIDLGQYQD